jgi:hypothetical protein
MRWILALSMITALFARPAAAVDERFLFRGHYYQVGESITIRGQEYKIESLQSRDRWNGLMTFKLVAGDKAYALKVPQSFTSGGFHEARKSIRQEVRTLFPRLDRAEIKHPKIIASGRDFLLREWSNGILGDEWLKQWEANDHSPDFPGYRELIRLFVKVGRQPRPISDLMPDNMSWNGEDWEVFDSYRDRNEASIPPLKEARRELSEHWVKGQVVRGCLLRALKRER